jgi:hypothetical protein
MEMEAIEAQKATQHDTITQEAPTPMKINDSSYCHMGIPVQ